MLLLCIYTLCIYQYKNIYTIIVTCLSNLRFIIYIYIYIYNLYIYIYYYIIREAAVVLLH